MADLNDAQAVLWKAAKPRTIHFNEHSAIYKKWLALRAEGDRIGVPIANELALDDGTVVQPFTSGVLLHWYGGDDVRME